MYEEVSQKIVDKLPSIISDMDAETLMQILPEDLFSQVLKCLYDYIFYKVVNDLETTSMEETI